MAQRSLLAHGVARDVKERDTVQQQGLEAVVCWAFGK